MSLVGFCENISNFNILGLKPPMVLSVDLFLMEEPEEYVQGCVFMKD